MILKTLLALLVSVGVAASIRTPTDELNDYITQWTATAPNRTAKAISYVPAVIAASETHGIDHMLLAVIISGESSWRESAIGGRGEIGLMQVHGQCAEGCDLTTPAGQIDCGAQCLSAWRERCGAGFDMAPALNGYASGKCGPILESTKRRVRLWQLATMGRAQ